MPRCSATTTAGTATAPPAVSRTLAKGMSHPTSPPKVGANSRLPSAHRPGLQVLPALLRVRPQPGALPEAKQRKLQQTLPLLPQVPVPLIGAGMRGQSVHTGSASGLSYVSACTDYINAAVNIINVKINNVLKPPWSSANCCWAEREISVNAQQHHFPQTLQKLRLSPCVTPGRSPRGEGGFGQRGKRRSIKPFGDRPVISELPVESPRVRHRGQCSPWEDGLAARKLSRSDSLVSNSHPRHAAAMGWLHRCCGNKNTGGRHWEEAAGRRLSAVSHICR